MSELIAERPVACLVDLSEMIARCLRMSRRNVDAMIMALVLPIMLLLTFVYLFGGAIHTGGRYVDYVVPGVLLVCAGFGVGTTAVSVSSDLGAGIVDRFRSMDVRADVIVTGHVVTSVIRNLVSTLVVVAVALAIGFRSSANALAWLSVVGLFAAFVFGLSWVCAALGTAATSPEAAAGFTFMIAFLTYPSSAFVPVDTMPTWLRGFAHHQPVTCVVDAMRGLLLGGPVESAAVQALAWSAGISLVGIAATSVLFRRRTR